MPSITIPVIAEKILVVGPIYDRMDLLPKIEEMLPQYRCIIFNGGLGFSADGLSSRIEKMQQLISSNKVIYLAGRSDYVTLNTVENKDITSWIRGLFNVAIIKFPNRTVIITGGGIPPGTKSINDLADNLETSFISRIDERPWHTSYNGGLGYVVSSNPLTDRYPTYYSYSMQLGNLYKPEVSVYAQEVTEIGLKQTILL